MNGHGSQDHMSSKALFSYVARCREKHSRMRRDFSTRFTSFTQHLCTKRDPRILLSNGQVFFVCFQSGRREFGSDVLDASVVCFLPVVRERERASEEGKSFCGSTRGRRAVRTLVMLQSFAKRSISTSQAMVRAENRLPMTQRGLQTKCAGVGGTRALAAVTLTRGSYSEGQTLRILTLDTEVPNKTFRCAAGVTYSESSSMRF